MNYKPAAGGGGFSRAIGSALCFVARAILEARENEARRAREEEADLPSVDVTKPYSKHHWRYGEDGHRII